MLHDKPHPRSGETVQVEIADAALPLSMMLTGLVRPGTQTTHELEMVLGDWESRMVGSQVSYWSRPAIVEAQSAYAIRLGRAAAHGASLPHDDEIVYGIIDGRGYLVHASEIVD